MLFRRLRLSSLSIWSLGAGYHWGFLKNRQNDTHLRPHSLKALLWTREFLLRACCVHSSQLSMWSGPFLPCSAPGMTGVYLGWGHCFRASDRESHVWDRSQCVSDWNICSLAFCCQANGWRWEKKKKSQWFVSNRLTPRLLSAIIYVWFSKCGAQNNIISITWKLDRNHWTTESETLGVRASNLRFDKSRGFVGADKVWEPRVQVNMEGCAPPFCFRRSEGLRRRSESGSFPPARTAKIGR